MSRSPFVTVAMPCLDERAHIRHCLDNLRGQDYPGDRVEILVADGGSRDGTREILFEVASQDPRVRVIENPSRIQAPGLNAILRQSRGEVVVRADVHCEYPPDYVRRCVDVLERTGADNVGGAQRARATTPFQAALAAALSSPLGVGGALYRSAKAEGFVDTVFLGTFRRRVFETVGLYDPGAVTNEDAELNQRIRQAGGRIYLSREIVVHYYPRASLGALARQYFRYGRGRARTLLKHGGFLSLRPLVPFLFVMAMLLPLAIPHLPPLEPWLLGAYVFIVLGEASRLAVTSRGRLLVPIALAFPAMHFSHGLGFAMGLVKYGFRPDWQAPERLPASAPAES